MTENLDHKKFFCEATLSWFIGLLICASLFYFLAISGANEYNPISLATFFGACYFLYKIFSQAIICFTAKYPFFNKTIKNIGERTKNRNYFGPILFTIIFGPVGSWLLLVVVYPSSNIGKISAMVIGLTLTFIFSYIWLNKNT